MPQTQDKPAATGEQDWLAEYAFAAAVLAFVYGFPTSTTPGSGMTG